MNRTYSLCALLAFATACSGGTSEPCVPNQACVPPSGANACTSYVTACDATTGATSCVVGSLLPDGDSCGAGKVCLANACITACVPGVTCTPTPPAAVCKSYATACSDKFTATSCEVGTNLADGTSCGTGLVCSSGGCVAQCTAGLACTPAGTPDPCKTYATTCSSTLAQQACAPAASAPDGTTCNVTSVCQAGVCLGALPPPTLNPASGSGAPPISVTITGPDPAAVVYFTTDGTPPSDLPATLSPSFTGTKTLVLQSTAEVQAFAKLGLQTSPTVIGVYTVVPLPPPPPPVPPVGVFLGSGFTAGSVQLNGVGTIDATRLVLTPTDTYQVASAFHPVALNVQTFTTTFSFQIQSAQADGLTFTIQGSGPFAMGSQGGGLGYGPDPFDSQRILSIGRSVAVKFDIYDNEGEGQSSTGVFLNGAVPTIPADDLIPYGIILRSGHVIDVRMVYDGTILRLTITDKLSALPPFTKDYVVDIPAEVGDVTGWVGFTAATGLKTASHQILNWTYTNAR